MISLTRCSVAMYNSKELSIGINYSQRFRGVTPLYDKIIVSSIFDVCILIAVERLDVATGTT